MSDVLLKGIQDLGVEFKAEQEKISQKISDEVKNINEDLAKKGKNLLEISEQIVEMKKEYGKKFMKVESENAQYTKSLISEAIKENYDQIKSVGAGSAANFRTKLVGDMTSALNLTSGAVQVSYLPGIQVRGRRKVHFRDLARLIPSATGNFHFYQQPTTVGNGGAFAQQAPGVAKQQMDYNMTEQIVTAQFLAGYTRFAKEMAQDLDFITNFIPSELLEDYMRTESATFFTALGAAATGSAVTTGVGTLTVYAELIIAYVSNLLANDYEPNAIVTTANQWAKLLITRPTDYNVPGGITISPDGDIMVMGIPVKVANNVAAGKTLIGDWSKAGIVQVDGQGLSVRFYEQDGNNVTKNQITALCEARVALAVLRPDAFIYA